MPSREIHKYRNCNDLVSIYIDVVQIIHLPYIDSRKDGTGSGSSGMRRESGTAYPGTGITLPGSWK